jgi:hypothetical protein
MANVPHVATRQSDSMATDEQKQAAQVIQRNYRGYRERRQLQGMGLDASARWAEVRIPFKCTFCLKHLVANETTRRYATVSKHIPLTIFHLRPKLRFSEKRNGAIPPGPRRAPRKRLPCATN